MLTVNNVTQRFGDLVALDRLSLSVSPGECFGLLGPNGAGKSTLMSLIAGLRRPTEGTVQVDGKSLADAGAAAKQIIGYTPQHIALYTRLSAEQNLRIFGELQGLRGTELRERCAELLQAVGLYDRRKDAVQTFSGGMQRRLNLAASLLHRPRLLLCDEPTVGVDPQSRNAIFEFLEARKAEGLTLIYSTHYMEEATRLCTRIGIIDHGRLLAAGTLAELLKHLPYDEEIAWDSASVPPSFADALGGAGTIKAAARETLFQPRADFARSEFYRRSEALGLPAAVFTHRRPSLEAVFLHLTGRTLRD
ncbi:ABC transporter ATP-binding protein [Nibricoccus sp. IMCC34717]|uniref:ABC transporter ATP-binding protein n=1 Tax=Nibricoccus sp. IMCC34717 TaxID=3034021 RepID=UPI00384DA37F